MARVLIIDDSDSVRIAIEWAIRHMGHEPESTASALMGLESALAMPPDLLLLDYRMPLMTGAELLRAITTSLGTCPRVIFVSSTPPGEIQKELLPTWHWGYIKKPFELADLSRGVAAALAE